ncbi:MAG: type I restriction enzyme HsdR N-terminal domain-containing protein [Oscillospiraceae bacterium]|nr:type I restriction enzyme HsdR N-terminal domain-containing protein [Oscillospiraceae bacterium]
MGIFSEIDFDSLPIHFKEDAVREEILLPLLNALGYSRFDSINKIISEYTLEDPFVTKGTKKRKIGMTPDYIIQIKGKNIFIIEAKAPSANITEGKHVEQAHSYANHRDVDSEIFVLCNGRELTVFNTRKATLIFKLSFATADKEKWGTLYELLSPAAFTFPNVFNYKPDYGVWCAKSGLSLDMVHHFYGIHVDCIAKPSDSLYSIQATVLRNGEKYYASFDFKLSLFEAFVLQIPKEKRDVVKHSLTHYPYKYEANCETDSFELSFSAMLGVEVLQDKHGVETFIPLNIISFL